MINFFHFFVLSQSSSICNSTSSTTLCNPTHAGSFDILITNLIVASGVLLGIFTIGMVAYSGFRMIISQGNEESVSEAKSSLRWSISGLVVILLAFAIVSAIGQFFQINASLNPNPGQIVSPISTNNIVSLSQTVFSGFLSVVGVVAIFFIVVSGLRYLTARGDQEQVAQAKKGLEWAVLGLVIAALAFVIVMAISKFVQQN